MMALSREPREMPLGNFSAFSIKATKSLYPGRGGIFSNNVSVDRDDRLLATPVLIREVGFIRRYRGQVTEEN
jgi:hypothetical protein